MNRISIKLSDLIKTKILETQSKIEKSDFLNLSYTKRFKKKKFLRKIIPKRKKTKSLKIINYLKFPKMQKNVLNKKQRKSLINLKLKNERGRIIKSEMKKIKLLNKNFDSKIKEYFQNKKLYKEKIKIYTKNEKKAKNLENLNFKNSTIKLKNTIKKNLDQKIEELKKLQNKLKKKEKEKLKNQITDAVKILKKNKNFLIKNIPKKPYFSKYSKKFIQACKLGENNFLEKLLKKNKNLIYEYDYFKLTGLHWAVKRNNFKTVDLLLKNKAFIDSRDYKGRTCLFYAFENMNSEIIFLLFKNDASPVLDRDFSEIKEKIGFFGKNGVRSVGNFFLTAKNGKKEFLKCYIDQVTREDN